MENQIVTHITQNGKYKIQFEQSAVKGVLGFKVEATGDEFNAVCLDATAFLGFAQEKAKIYAANLLEVKP
jgi:hypothetical protein